jgi:pre-rRNA-processing protein RIX1
VKSVCDDLLPPPPPPVQQNKIATNKAGKAPLTANADSFISSTAVNQIPVLKVSKLHNAAQKLLPLFISCATSIQLSPSLRARIDRTAILTNHKSAMYASILYPPPATKGSRGKGSVVPHLARAFGGDTDVEGLLRPRMPVLPIGRTEDESEAEDEEDDGWVEDEVNGGAENTTTGYSGLSIRYGVIDQATRSDAPSPELSRKRQQDIEDVKVEEESKRPRLVNSSGALQPQSHIQTQPNPVVPATAEPVVIASTGTQYTAEEMTRQHSGDERGATERNSLLQAPTSVRASAQTPGPLSAPVQKPESTYGDDSESDEGSIPELVMNSSSEDSDEEDEELDGPGAAGLES